MKQLILGDNPEMMLKIEAESIDLIYLDPALFSNRNFGSRNAQGTHSNTIKVIDNEGLETIEVVKVNREMEAV